MHDVRAIVADPAAFDEAMARRGLTPVAHRFVPLEEQRKRLTTFIQEGRERRNALAKEIGAKRKIGVDTSDLETLSVSIANESKDNENHLQILENQIKNIVASLPNVIDPDVPDGKNELDNVVEYTYPIKRVVPSNKNHFELLQDRMLFDTAAKMSGSRFTILTGNLARLERALGQFMLDLHTKEHGFTEVSVPLLVNDQTMFGTGQLPKFKDDLFQTTDGRWLIPTAEVSLTNMVAAEIIEKLPLRFVALTDCFRAEAGSAGRDVRGMLRQHQFKKVELVSIVGPDRSNEEHQYLTGSAERVLSALKLPWRRTLLCAGDTGFSAAKTYDLEVWLPGQGLWREISSCSNTRDFQARRMNARTRINGKLEFVHTLNGSGVAVGRALIAVLENYQQKDGSVIIPDVLIPYMDGTTCI